MKPSIGQCAFQIRPQGSRRVYSEPLKACAPLGPQLRDFLWLQFGAVPRSFVASVGTSRQLLDLDRTPAQLGLQPEDVIVVNWPTSLRGETVLEVARPILEQTSRALRKAATYGVETVCYWAGVWEDDRWKIIAVMRPRFLVATSSRVEISAEENRRIERMLPAQASIVAQVHSHLGPVFHSRWDGRYPFSLEPGFLSIVVPAYADAGTVWTSGVRVFELIRCPNWREWSPEEIRRRLQITEGSVNARTYVEGGRRQVAPRKRKRRPHTGGRGA